MYNSDKPGTKTEIPGVDTAPYGVEAPTPRAGWWLAEARGASARRELRCPSGQRRGPAAPGEDQVTCPGSEILPILYKSNQPGTETEIPRVDTAPHDMETPTPLGYFRLAGAHGTS